MDVWIVLSDKSGKRFLESARGDHGGPTWTHRYDFAHWYFTEADAIGDAAFVGGIVMLMPSPRYSQ